MAEKRVYRIEVGDMAGQAGDTIEVKAVDSMEAKALALKSDELTRNKNWVIRRIFTEEPL
jgi:hypothetical protein